MATRPGANETHEDNMEIKEEDKDIIPAAEQLISSPEPATERAISPEIDTDSIEAAEAGTEADAIDDVRIDPEVKGRMAIPRSAHMAYLVIAGAVFAAFAVIFLFLPRESYSELEKRDLAEFPAVADYSGKPAELTAAISQWFSDSEPFRDSFMALSMSVRDAMRVTIGGEEAVTFRPTAPAAATPATPAAAGIDSSNPLAENVSNPMANENATIASAGIIIVGKGEKVRALMAFGGSPKASQSYIKVLGEYASTFPDVHVYALVAPIATEFYLPEKAAKCSASQRTFIEHIRKNLPENVRFVDVYSALAAHVDEDIYFRTDHHWAPLGGFYAARELARTAGVPFKELSSYERKVTHNFVGSMYGYSKDIAIKNAPEDFVYYTPKDLDYKTTYVTYHTNSDYQIISESKPHEGKFFYHFKDGNGGAYLTFMGGDQHLVKITTGTPGNRKLLIIKDSYGNTLPGYMFYSFSEVHVVDFRYFKSNMVEYVRSNGITDIVVAFNVFNACSSSAAGKVSTFLRQRSGVFASPTPAKKNANAAKDNAASTKDNAKVAGENAKESGDNAKVAGEDAKESGDNAEKKETSKDAAPPVEDPQVKDVQPTPAEPAKAEPTNT